MLSTLTVTPRLVVILAVLTVGWLFLFVVVWALLWANAQTRRNVSG